MGQAATHSSYGSAWANLGNTPLNMYKHFCHEGGIASPLILHWPNGITPSKGFLNTPVHLMDLVPTVLEATGAPYPEKRHGHQISPLEGISLLPAISNPESVPERPLAFEHQGARGLRKGDWKVVWGKRQTDEVTWELYHLTEDRAEQNNLARKHPGITKRLVNDWEAWARRVGAAPFLIPEPGFEKASKEKSRSSPQIADRSFTIEATVEGRDLKGVVLAQGGKEQGFALHFLEGIPTFDVRINGTVTRLTAVKPLSGRIKLEGRLTAQHLSLTMNGETIRQTSPGLLPVQPTDPLSLGKDTRTAAGNYLAPNPFNGKILTHRVTPTKP